MPEEDQDTVPTNLSPDEVRSWAADSLERQVLEFIELVPVLSVDQLRSVYRVVGATLSSTLSDQLSNLMGELVATTPRVVDALQGLRQILDDPAMAFSDDWVRDAAPPEPESTDPEDPLVDEDARAEEDNMHPSNLVLSAATHRIEVFEVVRASMPDGITLQDLIGTCGRGAFNTLALDRAAAVLLRHNVLYLRRGRLVTEPPAEEDLASVEPAKPSEPEPLSALDRLLGNRSELP